MQDKNTIDVVIYHGTGCNDGFASALVVWMYYKQNGLVMPAFYGVSHDQLAKMKADEFADKNVLMCDIAPKFNQYVRIEPKSLLIIDHHKTAKISLASVAEHQKIFNMSKSGCVLVWKHFFPDVAVPMFFQHVQANDLWEKLPNTNEFITGLGIIPQEFELWKKAIDEVDRIIVDGRGMLTEVNLAVDALVKNAYICLHYANDKYYYVAYVNSPRYKSLVGSKLFERFPWISFSCVWHYDGADDVSMYSLRSTNDHEDVGAVAVSLGGGGHRNAAGVTKNGCHVTLYPRENDSGIWKQLDKFDGGDDTVKISVVGTEFATNSGFVGMLLDAFPGKSVSFDVK